MRFLTLVVCCIALAACSEDEPLAEQTATENTPPAAASLETISQEITMTGDQTPDIRREEVTYQAGETTLQGYIAYDANRDGMRPGVLVVHEGWGHNEYVRTRAHMLARMGYTALALDMYGDDKIATHPDDARKFMNEVVGNMALMQSRFNAAVELLRNHGTTDPDQIAAIGYSFGGDVVLNMARMGADLKGVASFHGTLATQSPAKAGEIKTEILVLHGADDPLIPPEQVDAFKAEMDAANAHYKFIAYPGATHSFTNPGATALGERYKLPLAYNETADEQSWMALERFLNRIFAEVE